MATATGAMRARPLLRLRAIAAGMVASGVLLTLYLAVISLAQGPAHAIEQLQADAPFIGLITAGFGTQVALFAELWAVDRRHRAGAAVAAAGTGTSAAAMLACCAHHVADVLPILGLSAAAVFLNTYRLPLFVLSLGMNAAGIAIIARQLRRARRACAVADSSSD